MRLLLSAALGAALVLVCHSADAQQSKDPRLVPNRISGVGDSITEAINAEEYNIFRIINPNPWASYSNGYYGFWEWLLGRTNVYSHNQRISRNFGSRGRANFLDGVSGAGLRRSRRPDDGVGQPLGHLCDHVHGPQRRMRQ